MIQGVLDNLPDPGVGSAAGVFRQPGLKAAIGQTPVDQFIPRQHRQQMGGVDQGFLGGLPESRLDFHAEDVQGKVDAQSDDQEVAEKQLETKAHGRLQRDGSHTRIE